MRLVAGIDEVGMGPLAGPVVAAVVILRDSSLIEGLRDSKQLSERRRERMVDVIKAEAVDFALGRAEASEIDQLNVLQAAWLAMRRAVEGLRTVPEFVLVDGLHVPKSLPCPGRAIVRGDACVPAISAASIVAKVARDREMRDWDAIYPEYGFGAHKGYGTARHLVALQQYGACPLHRMSFAPVRRARDGRKGT